MRRLAPNAFAALLGLSVIAGISASAQYERELGSIKKEWTRIALMVPQERQAEAYRELAARAKSLANRHPAREEPRRWESVAQSAYLRRAGGPRHA
jgi:hypothetical protein